MGQVGEVDTLDGTNREGLNGAELRDLVADRLWALEAAVSKQNVWIRHLTRRIMVLEGSGRASKRENAGN